MNAEQKKRIAHEISNWKNAATAVQCNSPATAWPPCSMNY